MDGMNRHLLFRYNAKQTKKTLDKIIDVVCKEFDTDPVNIHGKSRKRVESVLPRQACMYLARKITKLPYSVIGKRYGGRDHATVLHAVKCVNDMVDIEYDLFIDNFRNTEERLIQEYGFNFEPIAYCNTPKSIKELLE